MTDDEIEVRIIEIGIEGPQGPATAIDLAAIRAEMMLNPLRPASVTYTDPTPDMVVPMARYETYWRQAGGYASEAITVPQGTQHYQAIWLPEGEVVGGIVWWTSESSLLFLTAAPSELRFGLYDADVQLLAQTAAIPETNPGMNIWPGRMPKYGQLITPYVVPSAGLHYLSIAGYGEDGNSAISLLGVPMARSPHIGGPDGGMLPKISGYFDIGYTGGSLPADGSNGQTWANGGPFYASNYEGRAYAYTTET